MDMDFLLGIGIFHRFGITKSSEFVAIVISTYVVCIVILDAEMILLAHNRGTRQCSHVHSHVLVAILSGRCRYTRAGADT
jgi:hypothetical protein